MTPVVKAGSLSLTKLFKSCSIHISIWPGLLSIALFSVSSVMAQPYFQQEVNHRVEVSLDDRNHRLRGHVIIEYINHSPDSLFYLYMHLWPNAYSGNHTPLARQLFQLHGRQKLFDDYELRGYIDSLDFKIDNRRVEWSLLPGQPDVCKILPRHVISPGDTLVIATPFRVKIPKGVTSRLGHTGQSYQITQWYPKPAVYDQDGWHPMSYLDQGEFYSEYGTFDVRITLPANYLVASTGVLQNPVEEAQCHETLVAGASRTPESDAPEGDFPISSPHLKTLRFTAHNVHDFAWFADKRFQVKRGSVKLPHSGREVTTRVMFTHEQAALWKDALSYVNDALLYFSEKIGDYPYESFTAVQSALSAGVGMEYPALTVIGYEDDAFSLDEVLAHEIAHSWFYAALGTNERRYPYLDEGLTTAYTSRYINAKYPNKKLWEVLLNNRKVARLLNVDEIPLARMEMLEWLIQARANMEQPMNLPADRYTPRNYGAVVYSKASVSFNYLRAYLGDSLFDATLHVFYRTWQFKHPQPEDLRRAFEKQTGKDLSWFFEDLTGTTKSLDYKMARLDGRRLLMKNKGELAAPVIIAGLTGDSVHWYRWIEGFEGEQWVEIPEGTYSEIKIDPNHVMPELYRINNNIARSGIFPKADPIQARLLFSVADPEKHTLNYFPAINWNRENGFMIGLGLHNGIVVPKRFEYLIMPFYAFGNSHPAGSGRIAYNILPYQSVIRKATLTIEGKQYGAPGDQNYHALQSGFAIYFRGRNTSLPVSHSLYGNYMAASNLSRINRGEPGGTNSYFRWGYKMEQARLVNPYSLSADFEQGKDHLKATLGLNYRLSYYGRDNGLDMRLFAGTMLTYDPQVAFHNLAPSGRRGDELYLYPGTYPNRFAHFTGSFWSRQTALTEGGVVSYLNDSLGYSRRLISLTLASSLPGKMSRIPVKPFVNLLLNDKGLPEGPDSHFFFEGGIKAGAWNLFEVYIPLVASKNIRTVTGEFKERIRFVFTLDAIKL